MSKEECRKLVRDIFGEEAASDEDIVSWYMEVNNVALDETYNQAIDDAIEVVKDKDELYRYNRELNADEKAAFSLTFRHLISKLTSLKK